jgi:hypothetical protein
MADLAIASIDLAAGLKLKKLYMPETVINVVIQNAPADLVKAAKDDKLTLQPVIEAAFDSLASAKSEFQSAMKDLDAKFDKNPLKTVKELADRAETLSVMYKQIAQAQAAAAAKAAENAWAVAARKKKDLLKYKVKFWANAVLGALSIAASVTSAVMSLGVLAVTIIGAAKTCVQLAKSIYDYMRSLSDLEKTIEAADEVIQQTWKEKSNAGKIMGRDLASALGVPFVKSVAGLRKNLDEYSAKCGAQTKAAEKMWTEAQEIMTAIGKLPDDAGDKKTEKELGTAVTKLLDEISDVMKNGKANDAFYAEFSARADKYEKMEGNLMFGGAKVAPATEFLTKAGGLAAFANTVVEIAMKLA